MSGRKRMSVAVPVATVWTKPESARPVDEAALRNPAAIADWLEAMTLDDRLDLCAANRVQTQMLLGTPALVEDTAGEWAKVLIPEQPTGKSEAGYPGWVPLAQLAEEPSPPAGGYAARAAVVADKAWLYRERSLSSGKLMEVGYMTELPVLEEAGEWVKLRTPAGDAYARGEQLRLSGGARAKECGPLPVRGGAREEEREPLPVSGIAREEEREPLPSGGAGAGAEIAAQAARFIGLPYLWGGMSSWGYDCSGYAYSMHRFCGILIPRDASDQAMHGTEIDRESLEPGDLLFFAYEEGKGAVHHVGIYAGDNRMLHSPRTGRTVELVDLDGYELEREHCISRRYWG